MKKTVCVVMPGYHNTVHNFCNELARQFRVVLLLPRRESPYTITGNKYQLVRLPSISPSLEIPLTPSIVSVVRRVGADIIIAGEDFQPNTALLALFHRCYRKPFIVINEKYFLSRMPHLVPLHRIMLNTLTKRFVWRVACKIVLRSSEAKRFAISNGACLRKLQIIPMGIETPRLLDARGGAVEINQQLTMITVGRLIPLKGVRYLLEAIRILKKEGIGVRLTIVGDGPLGGPLRKLVRLWKLQDHVKFFRHIPHDELLRTYRDFHVYVQPSTVEVVGLAALEALASGLALVVSDIGGLRDIVQDGQNGYRVPAADPVALANAIRMLASNPADVERMRVESHRRARELFSWEVVTEKYVNAIASCLD